MIFNIFGVWCSWYSDSSYIESMYIQRNNNYVVSSYDVPKFNFRVTQIDEKCWYDFRNNTMNWPMKIGA